MATCARCGGDLPDGTTRCPACRPPNPNSLLDTETAPGAPGGSVLLQAGTVLADCYRILAFGVRGGEGEVYRADDLKLAQTVAVKILAESVRADERRLARLIGEVRTARVSRELAPALKSFLPQETEAEGQKRGRHSRQP